MKPPELRWRKGIFKLLRRWSKPSSRSESAQRVLDRLGLWVWRLTLYRRAHAGTLNRFGARLVPLVPGDVDSQIPLSALPLALSTARDAVGWTLGGDWDLNPVPLTSHPVFVGIRQRFLDGLEWHDTELYARAGEGLAGGRPLWKFRNVQDLPRLFAKIENLHAQISSDGYLTQRELGSARLWDEVLIAIDRNGRRHLVDGAHRLALAQVLGLDSVPALVAVCHRDWEGVEGES